MSKHKVHVIEPDFQAQIDTVVQRRDDLGREIVKLAERENETVFFHDYTEPCAAAPVMMLECSDDFLEKVRALPGAANIHDGWPNMPTERNATVQQYFNDAATPPQPPRKKPGPGPKP